MHARPVQPPPPVVDVLVLFGVGHPDLRVSLILWDLPSILRVQDGLETFEENGSGEAVHLEKRPKGELVSCFL